MGRKALEVLPPKTQAEIEYLISKEGHPRVYAVASGGSELAIDSALIMNDYDTTAIAKQFWVKNILFTSNKDVKVELQMNRTADFGIPLTTVYYSGTLATGSIVYSNVGMTVVQPNGTYIIQDGRVIIVTGGTGNVSSLANSVTTHPITQNTNYNLSTYFIRVKAGETIQIPFNNFLYFVYKYLAEYC